MTFSTEDFLKALDQHSFDFQAGSVVQGKVFSHAAEGAYIDIGGKSAAFLPLKEASLDTEVPLEAALPLDSEREFLIVRDQDANGQVILSIRRLEIQQVWERLLQRQETNDILEVEVTGTNKGGVVVDAEGLRGFVPRSHLVGAGEDLSDFVGQQLSVAFLEVNPDANKLVLSQRIAAQAATMAQLSEGQLVEGTVAALKPFGVFVDFEGVRGLLHVNQISKGYVPSISDLFQVGQPVKVVVVGIDDVRNRISLSTKVLEKYPGEILKDRDTLMAKAAERAQDVAKMLAERDA
ncbi:MAG: S1 RNA-binding domain-containing protein [Leptolyngbya sp. SIO4C1]|nr:S1 RNA-binding domain-containing protein [Leptolyngbya sp. SIO4C1]